MPVAPDHLVFACRSRRAGPEAAALLHVRRDRANDRWSLRVQDWSGVLSADRLAASSLLVVEYSARAVETIAWPAPRLEEASQDSPVYRLWVQPGGRPAVDTCRVESLAEVNRRHRQQLTAAWLVDRPGGSAVVVADGMLQALVAGPLPPVELPDGPRPACWGLRRHEGRVWGVLAAPTAQTEALDGGVTRWLWRLDATLTAGRAQVLDTVAKATDPISLRALLPATAGEVWYGQPGLAEEPGTCALTRLRADEEGQPESVELVWMQNDQVSTVGWFSPPPGTRPMDLLGTCQVAVDPGGEWLAASDGYRIVVWTRSD